MTQIPNAEQAQQRTREQRRFQERKQLADFMKNVMTSIEQHILIGIFACEVDFDLLQADLDGVLSILKGKGYSVRVHNADESCIPLKPDYIRGKLLIDWS